MFECGDGIYGTDSFYEREGCTSIYIICNSGRCGIIESAANSSLPHLLSALDELGVDYANVDFLALTHVHLDHAGGAGSYMQKFPNAKLIVHPRGAKHMADPTALIEGVCEVYGKSVLFDYSYKFFYEDGYGKESLILNLNPELDKQDDRRYEYFTACLLSFYQQQYLFNKHKDKLAEFNIEKPGAYVS